jgi:hypothetical protein
LISVRELAAAGYFSPSKPARTAEYRECHVDEQTILASDENFGNVSVCPGGVVHINLVHLTLKLMPEDFVRFSELIGKARLNLHQKSPARSKPHLQVVASQPGEDQGPTKQE